MLSTCGKHDNITVFGQSHRPSNTWFILTLKYSISMHSPSICSRVYMYAYMYEPYKLHHAVTCDVNAFPWAL